MIYTKELITCLAAGALLVMPMQASAAQLNLALSGGISDALDSSETSGEEMEEALDEAIKTTYTGMGFAVVDNYVNIRSEPTTESEAIGKLYDKSVATIEDEVDGWYLITSGNVHGYVKGDYIAIAADAEEIAAQVGSRVATVTTETLRVRQDATTDSPILGLIPLGEELTVTDETDTFVKVSIWEGDGWVSKDYVELRTDYVYAESREEEEARLAKEAEARAAAHEAAEKKAAESKSKTEVAVGNGAGSASGNSVASFASQFVGNPYVYGGSSLTNGTDCSGFVMSVYANFGVGLPHSSSALRGVGYGVSLADAQPGDIICYSGHVGIYVGNNTIVHASTPSTGIKFTSPANYKNVLAVRRIF